MLAVITVPVLSFPLVCTVSIVFILINLALKSEESGSGASDNASSFSVTDLDITPVDKDPVDVFER